MNRQPNVYYEDGKPEPDWVALRVQAAIGVLPIIQQDEQMQRFLNQSKGPGERAKRIAFLANEFSGALIDYIKLDM